MHLCRPHELARSSHQHKAGARHRERGKPPLASPEHLWILKYSSFPISPPSSRVTMLRTLSSRALAGHAGTYVRNQSHTRLGSSSVGTWTFDSSRRDNRFDPEESYVFSVRTATSHVG